MYECNPFNLDPVRDNAFLSARQLSSESFREILALIQDGDIAKPHGVTEARYAAMIRNLVRHKQPNVFLKP